MNKSIIKIGVIVLSCVITLSGCLGLQDKLNPNNRDKRNLEEEPLKLMDHIPWNDYQKTSYAIYSREEKYGSMEIEITKSADAKSYEIIKVKESDTDEIRSGTTIMADTLMPTKSYYNKISEYENFEISTSYTKDWYINTESKKPSEQTIDLPEYYYDNESLLIILGALSYEDFDTFKLNVTIPLSGRVTPLKFKYEGKEQIHVPYGETDSYKITSGSMTFWYSTNDRILYQYKDGDITYKLIDMN